MGVYYESLLPSSSTIKTFDTFFSGQSSYGNPAQDYIEKGIDLNELCVNHPADTYFVIATGMSMVDAGIYEGPLLVVDRSLQAKHGDIIITSVAGECTVKHKRPHGGRLIML